MFRQTVRIHVRKRSASRLSGYSWREISLHFRTILAVNFQKSRSMNHNKRDQPDGTLRRFNNTPLNVVTFWRAADNRYATKWSTDR